MVFAREQARVAKDWALADSVRERLSAAGVTLFDKTNSWRSSDGQTGKIPTWSDLEAGQTAETVIALQATMMLQRGDPHAPEGSEGHIKYLVQQREQARGAKDWAQSDKIRDELRALGVEINDKDKLWRSKSGAAGIIIGYRGASGPSDLEINTLMLQREKARQNSDYATGDMIRNELRQVGVEVHDRDKTWRTADGRRGQVPSWSVITTGAGPPAPQMAVAQPVLMMTPAVQSAPGVSSTMRNQIVQAALAAAQNPASATRALQLLQQVTAPQQTIAQPRAPVPARPAPPQPTPQQPGPRGAVCQEAQDGIEFINRLKEGDQACAEDAEIEWLVSVREKCRQNKDFVSADELRNHMRAILGVELFEQEKKWVASDGRQGAIPLWGSLAV